MRLTKIAHWCTRPISQSAYAVWRGARNRRRSCVRCRNDACSGDVADAGTRVLSDVNAGAGGVEADRSGGVYARGDGGAPVAGTRRGARTHDRADDACRRAAHIVPGALGYEEIRGRVRREADWPGEAGQRAGRSVSASVSARPRGPGGDHLCGPHARKVIDEAGNDVRDEEPPRAVDGDVPRIAHSARRDRRHVRV